MNGYGRDRLGSVICYFNGVRSYQDPAVERSDWLSVTNGNYQGDHKTPNPFSFTKTEWIYPAGTILAWSNWGGGQSYVYDGSFSGSLGLPFTRPASRREVAWNKALAKFYDAIKQSERNLLVTLGETPESVRMFKSFLAGISSVKSGIRRALRRPDLALSGAWLVNQYGIQPAMADVYQWVDYCRGKAAHELQPVRVRASVKSFEDYSLSTWPPVRASSTLNERVEVKARYRVSNPELFEISRITSLNPATVAWELTPLSFVADWFIDIGGYLQSLENSLGLGLTFVDGYVTDTSLLTVKGAWSGSRPKPASGYAEYFISAPYNVVEKHLARERLASFPRPALPRWDVNLGSSRLLSAAALLNTLFLRRT